MQNRQILSFRLFSMVQLFVAISVEAQEAFGQHLLACHAIEVEEPASSAGRLEKGMEAFVEPEADGLGLEWQGLLSPRKWPSN